MQLQPEPNMFRTIEDFGLSRDNPLINDIADTWGNDLSNLSQVTIAYLVAKIATYKLIDCSHGQLDSRAKEVIRRIGELDCDECVSLVKAFIHAY